MNRLQRKCLVASAVTHGLLLIMLLVGSAFAPQRHPEPTTTIPFTLFTMPDMIIDEPNFVGGGNPKAGQPTPTPAPPIIEPQPAPPQPTPRQETRVPEPEPPKPEVRPRPEPEREAPKPAAPDPEPQKAEPKYRPSFDISKAERKTIAPKSNSDSSAAAQKAAADQRDSKVANAFGSALQKMQNGLSSSVGEIGVPGPGGPAYASYNLVLRKFYEDAWNAPLAGGDNEPVVLVEVTISRDGSVLSWRFLRKSRRRELDNSVEDTMNRVKKVPPFPSGSRDERRTFKINFNLSSKLNIG